MTDIVKRMTDAGNDLTVLNELEFAALVREGRDEIERLNEECRQSMVEIANGRSDNERLRAALEVCAHPLTDWIVAVATASAALKDTKT